MRKRTVEGCQGHVANNASDWCGGAKYSLRAPTTNTLFRLGRERENMLVSFRSSSTDLAMELALTLEPVIKRSRVTPVPCRHWYGTRRSKLVAAQYNISPSEDMLYVCVSNKTMEETTKDKLGQLRGGFPFANSCVIAFLILSNFTMLAHLYANTYNPMYPYLSHPTSLLYACDSLSSLQHMVCNST